MKKYRIISIILIFILLFSSLGVFADLEGDLERAKNDGTKYGAAAGKSQGIDDFKNEFKSDWERGLDDDKISGLYLLDYEDPLYKEEFLIYYKIAYKEAYESAYSGSEKEKEEAGSSAVGGLGAALGMIHGEIDGLKDFESGRPSNWSRAMPRLGDMDRIFDLRKLPVLDRDTFMDKFTTNYQLGYENSYYNAHFGSEKNNMDAGRIDGIIFGTMMGKSFGIKDYHEGRSLDYNRNMPRKSEIRSDYSLNSDNLEYTEGFLNGFKNSYQESYASGFREAKNNIILLEDSSAYENGNAVGQIQGKIQGNMDHMEKKSNDWKRSRALSSTIIFEYNLIYQTEKYRDSFINGYWNGYALGYDATYKELSQSGATIKTSSVTVPISGETVSSLDASFAVGIDKGIYYKPVIVTIDSLNESYSVSDRYISASNFYRLNVVNPSGVYAKDKKIKIAFEYYGDKDGGIYQLENGKWTYLTSTIEDGAIVANVNPSTISSNGNVFAVLVDTETTIFHDIRGHWAKDEITAYIRRGVINGYQDQKFRPDNHITRAEFLALLSRLYEWYMPYDTSNNLFFKDHESLNQFNEKYISYSLTNGYIIGYPDRYFRPNNSITYKEVDYIMSRVLKDPTFKWEKYAEKMQYEKKTRSSSYNSYNNYITRAEFSYMLYKLNEWKY